MLTGSRLYKTRIKKKIDLSDVERVVSASDALLHRVDQKDDETVVFFSARKKALAVSRRSFAKYGKTAIRAVDVGELLELP